MEKIGIVIPVYKAEPYLQRCMDSIFNQTYQNMQIVLVDDGSPDRSGQMCEEFAAGDSRIHVIHQANSGQAVARNVGIDWMLANTDVTWLCFVDSDDWIHRDCLRILLQAARQHGAQIAVSNLQRTDKIIPDALVEEDSIAVPPAKAITDYYALCISPCFKIYHRELFREIRFPAGVIYEDACITHLLTLEANKVAVCDVPLYYYYANLQSTTRQNWTPRQLEQMAAHELRLDYFREHGYTDVYYREFEVYTDALLAQAELITTAQIKNREYRKYLPELQKKIRFALKEEKKIGRLQLDYSRFWFYYSALMLPVFPTLSACVMRLKWTLKDLLHL